MTIYYTSVFKKITLALTLYYETSIAGGTMGWRTDQETGDVSCVLFKAFQGHFNSHFPFCEALELLLIWLVI